MLFYYQFSFLLGSLSSFIIAASIFFIRSGDQVLNKQFSFLVISGGFWSAGFYFLISAQTEDVALFWRWFMESSSILLPALWLNFVFSFLEISKKKIFPVILVIYTISFLLWVLNFLDFIYIPGVFMSEMVALYDFNYYAIAGFGYYAFFIYFSLVILYSLTLLYRASKTLTQFRAIQVKYIFFAALLGFAGGGMTFFPTLGIPIQPFGVILFSLYPVFIAYAILRHNLFNIRIIATEILVLTLWGAVLVRLVFSETDFEKIINLSLLGFIVLIGFLLIRGVLADVRARERIEKLVQDIAKANARLWRIEKQKTEFVSIASHQLRTPLTAIKGYASMLLEGSFGELPENVRRAVENIFRSSQKLVSLVEDFLTLSRIEQKRMVFQFDRVDMLKILRELAAEFQVPAKEKKLKLMLETDGARKYFVRADSGKLRQVFYNIIDNAVKYTERGFVRILFTRDEMAQKIRISVSDTGTGMSSNTLTKLFERFDRKTTKRHMQGSGLGLYITSEIVKAHRGKIWSDSRGIGQGSTFFVEFPAWESAKRAP